MRAKGSNVILYPDLLLTKPRARSGQIRFVHVIAGQECNHRWPKRNMRVCMGEIEFET